MDFSAVIALAALIATILGAVWTQGIWISKQFAVLKDFVNTKVDIVMDKLEYHEKHDDSRFNDISNRIWTLRLENAQDKGKQRFSTSKEEYQTRNVRGATVTSDSSGI